MALAAGPYGGWATAQPVPAHKAPPHLASLGWRVLAVVLDFIAIWSVVSAIAILIPPHLMDDGFAEKGLATLVPFGLCLVGLLYYILLEAFFGATPGKGIAGIQVRLCGDEACTFRASLIRNLLRIVDAFAAYLVGFIVALLSKSRQRLGDLAAGTIVVRRPATAIVRGLLVLLWLGIASSGFVACHLVPPH